MQSAKEFTIEYYSDAISEFRRDGYLADAIQLCKEAVDKFPQSNFFCKILGDLYMQSGYPVEAGDSYIKALKRMGDSDSYFKIFVKFYYYFSDKVDLSTLESYKKKIRDCIYANEFSPAIVQSLLKFLGFNSQDFEYSSQILIKTNNDINFNEIKKYIQDCESSNRSYNLSTLFEYRVNAEDRRNSVRIDMYIVTMLEQRERYNEAIIISSQLCRINKDAVIRRTLFRLCRKKGDYEEADAFIADFPEVLSNNNFNVQYELVYYFDNKKDFTSRNKSLQIIQNNSTANNLPISKTLFNFYLRFGMLDEADIIQKRINEINTKRQSVASLHVNEPKSRKELVFEAESETSDNVFLKLREMTNEQEHTRQMLALRDLLRGFSHELGQPITNIRYPIQLFQEKMKRGISTEQDLVELLDKIIKQSERMGLLLDRFRPIVSTKNMATRFNIQKQILSVFSEVEYRLSSSGVTYVLSGRDDVYLYGDPVQFNQIFLNLIINAIHSIGEKGGDDGKITVNIQEDSRHIRIFFSDNGTGIPHALRQKVFEPFFSTKDPSEGNGGEGLGLYIIWNILKMLGGTISLVDSYTDGARFKIIFDKREVAQ